MTPTPITFDQAERVGQALHDRWAIMTKGNAPLTRDDMAWSDIVQFVIRKASEVSGEDADKKEPTG